jgi:hypothetical protein
MFISRCMVTDHFLPWLGSYWLPNLAAAPLLNSPALNNSYRYNWCFAICSLGTDRTENIPFNSSSIAESLRCLAIAKLLFHIYEAVA